jgi:hypothetical protein
VRSALSERKRGVANLYKEVTVFVFWDDESLAAFASRHRCAQAIFHIIYIFLYDIFPTQYCTSHRSDGVGASTNRFSDTSDPIIRLLTTCTGDHYALLK